MMPAATTRSPLLEELAWRGLLHQQTEGVGKYLDASSRGVYCGFDPTAPSLHIGNLVPVMLLVHLARAGHPCVALVGGGTAMIGDPSGRSAERPLLDQPAIDAHAAKIHGQLLAVFTAAKAKGVTLANNADWLRDVRMIEFMRDVGKH